jgi:thymidylate kinase
MSQFTTRRRPDLPRLWPRTIVTFSGLDGAGKSSQSRRLRAALQREGVVASIEWVPVAINPSIGIIKTVGKRILAVIASDHGRVQRGQPGVDAAEVDAGKRLVRRSPAARHVWSTIVTAANVYSHWRALARHRDSDVLIFDRYALDTAVRLHTWYDELGSVAFQSWLVRRLSPRTLQSYLLDVPADRALARKVDRWDLEVLTRQAELYRRDCGRFGVRRLDGERNVEDLAAEISVEVLGRLGRRPARPPMATSVSQVPALRRDLSA